MIPVLKGVMAGHSRSENGVASLAYVPAISLSRQCCIAIIEITGTRRCAAAR